MSSPALPCRELSAQLCDSLRSTRARLSSRTGIARRRHVLELRLGWGLNLGELLQRSSGEVTGLDSDRNAVRVAVQFVKSARVHHVHARTQRLPFADNQFDLVFTQFAFL